MKFLKNRIDFIKENKSYDHIEIDADGMESTIKDYHDSVEDFRDELAANMNLKSGNIEFGTDYFYVNGIMEDDIKLKIEQDGEFNSYGGPYDPKMEKPIVEFDGVDVYQIFHKEALEQEYFEQGNYMDMTRSDLFTHIFSMSREKKINIIKGSSGINKYNL